MKTIEDKKYKVAELAELPFQEGWVVTAGDEEIVLFHLTDGDVRAVENRCPILPRESSRVSSYLRRCMTGKSAWLTAKFRLRIPDPLKPIKSKS